MDLFGYIPDEYVEGVTLIINNKQWNNEQKLSLLRAVIDGPLLLKMCKDYLETKNAEPASSPSSFIQLLPPEEQTLARGFVHKENIKALGLLIQNRKDDKKLKAAYFQWKAYYQQEKIDNILPGLKDTHANFDYNNDLLHRLPKETNIVFLGGTGSGKSTLINAFVNYIKFGTLEEAVQHDPIVLIPFIIKEFDEQLTEHEVRVAPTVKIEEGSEANEITRTGESATQSPRAYHIHYTLGNQEKLVRIIDTPGVGDTNGLLVERMNMEKILVFLSQYEQIHAFCITMKTNESRRNLAFEYPLNQLLTQLHNSAANNIMFALTNAGATQFKVGDTYPCLQAHAREIRDKRGIQINVDKETVHCFENDCYRYLCATRADPGLNYTDEEKQMFSSGWKHSATSALKLMSRIAELPPHSLVDTVSIHNCRTVINILGQPLAQLFRNQALNQRIMQEKIAQVEECLREGKNLEGQLYMEEMNLKVEKTNYPATVCTGSKCVTYERLSKDSNQRLKTVYSTVCHAHCYVKDVQEDKNNNPLLKMCTAMGDTVNGGDTCTVCKCDWSTHMHIYYKYTEEKQKIEVPDVAQGLAKNEMTRMRASLFLIRCKERSHDLEVQKEHIKNYCAEMACFLKANALLPYNDRFGEYIDYLILEERGKVSNGALDDVLQDLINAKEEYDRQVEFMTADVGRPAKTLKEINKMIKELKDEKKNGNLLREVQRIKLRYNRAASNRNVSNVSLRNGFRKMYPTLPDTMV